MTEERAFNADCSLAGGNFSDSSESIDSGTDQECDDGGSQPGEYNGYSNRRKKKSSNASSALESNDAKNATSAGDENAISQQETKTVLAWKLLVLAVLFVSAITVALIVYLYLSNAEHNRFAEKHKNDANKVMESVGQTLALTLGVVDTFTVGVVAYSDSNDEVVWPYVTVPGFAIQASKMRSLSKAFMVTQYNMVTEDNLEKWTNYSRANNGWINDALQLQKEDPTFNGKKMDDYTGETSHVFTGDEAPYFVKWQSSPIVPLYSPYNTDLKRQEGVRLSIPELLKGTSIISQVTNVPLYPDKKESQDEADLAVVWYSTVLDLTNNDPSSPASDIYYPILKEIDDSVVLDSDGNFVRQETDLMGIMAVTFFWKDLLRDTLPVGSDGMLCIIRNDCGQAFTYRLAGPNATFVGAGDRHNSKYNGMEKSIALGEITVGVKQYTGLPLGKGVCRFSLHAYPSEEFESLYTTKDPITLSVSVILIFVFSAIIFLVYDHCVEARQRSVLKTAVESSAIVSNLFPSNVRERLYNAQNAEAGNAGTKSAAGGSSRSSLLQQQAQSNTAIADLFPSATVLFADIAGFTSWSSARSPEQVFSLLEAIYGAFDEIANRRGVFKVETIGDCYVAVCGLPAPRKDHAVVIAKFAGECMRRMLSTVRRLEVSLGPGTADLSMRFGAHSGAVTAGVLRGEKSRFQLFGDTVNTASRCESTGKRNRIQVSEATAELLISAGKSHWLKPREDLVEAKGKGLMKTFWVIPGASAGRTTQTTGSSAGDASVSPEDMPDKNDRLVAWNADVLLRLLRQIVARRAATKRATNRSSKIGSRTMKSNIDLLSNNDIVSSIQEVIELPTFDARVDSHCEDANLVTLPDGVETQMHEYIGRIAESYNDNPFHNFSHCSHVCMSVLKLLSRIVAPTAELTSTCPHSKIASKMHDHTYGITSDPLTQFACVWSALVHDADHPGVSNAQLVAEKTEVAAQFNGKSPAEQHSLQLAWNMLMEPCFDELRWALCEDQTEMDRFKQLVVNSVMATDVFDKDLKQLRNTRWENAFSESIEDNANANRKATIVIEHLIQASDVSHTMQHWHIFRKWNELLFEEMYLAFVNGRSETNPSKNWYNGELGFFDFYVIPLTKKLSECGVFGVSSDEYYQYAKKNRTEWEEKGEEIVASMLAACQSKYKSKLEISC